MAYFAPYIDAAGLHIPNYIDIREDLISQFKQIYGQDIYLDNDSQDYQMISAFALKTYDLMQFLQIIYNNRSPKSAVGSALDGVVKLNGIKRKSASYSNCVLTLLGETGSVIKNGIVQDEAGVKWLLPATVTIKNKEHQVTAICEDIGAVEAMPGVISKIVTPTKGWISVINKVPAVVGAPVEKDEELRLRQSLSVAIPSRTLLDGAIGGIASIDGVKRYKIYENDTNITDKNGIPGHSIGAVIEGGTDEDVAAQIYLHKGIGCGTYGDIEVEYTHVDDLPNLIRFSRPEYISINVEINIKKMVGYTDEIKHHIENCVEEYLQSLDIGNDVVVSSVWAAALSVLTTLARPSFSVQQVNIARNGEELKVSDIITSYKEVTQVGIISIKEV